MIGQSDSLHRAVGGSGNGVEIRSARLGMSGSLYERLIFKSDFDFAGGDADMKDVYVGVQKIPGVGTLMIGHFKEPFGLEEMNSSRHIVFMERSMLQIFYPVRNVGLMAHNTAFDKRMTWSAGVFRPTNDYGKDFGSD